MLPDEKKKEQEINKELENWNIVRCRICGRELDMLKKEVHYINGDTPVCKNGCR